jgi:hypothetical protein
LKQLGIAQSNADDLKDCPGALVPEPEKRICPREPMLVAMVGLPDPMGRRAFVRVLIIAADSRSKAALVTGYIMEPRSDHWALVEKRLDVIVE